MVLPKEVRQHFVFVQRSKDVEETELKKLKEEVYSLSDAELKREITEPTNQIFNDDNLLWEIKEISVGELHSCYNNLQGIPLSKVGLNYQEIVEELKEKERKCFEHNVLSSIRNADVAKVKEMLPIFVVKNNGQFFVHDGQRRTTTLAYHGEQKIKSFVCYGRKT